MKQESANQNNQGTVRSFLIILLVVLAIAAWGGFIFLSIGDRGQPEWQYGTISDVPGKSPYSTLINK